MKMRETLFLESKPSIHKAFLKGEIFSTVFIRFLGVFFFLIIIYTWNIKPPWIILLIDLCLAEKSKKCEIITTE